MSGVSSSASARCHSWPQLVPEKPGVLSAFSAFLLDLPPASEGTIFDRSFQPTDLGRARSSAQRLFQPGGRQLAKARTVRRPRSILCIDHQGEATITPLAFSRFALGDSRYCLPKQKPRANLRWEGLRRLCGPSGGVMTGPPRFICCLDAGACPRTQGLLGPAESQKSVAMSKTVYFQGNPTTTLFLGYSLSLLGTPRFVMPGARFHFKRGAVETWTCSPAACQFPLGVWPLRMGPSPKFC